MRPSEPIQARSVELPDQRGRNCLHVFRFVVEGSCWHAVDRELKIGRSITGVTILVAPVQSRKRGHRHLGAAADKSSAERVSRQREACCRAVSDVRETYAFEPGRTPAAIY